MPREQPELQRRRDRLTRGGRRRPASAHDKNERRRLREDVDRSIARRQQWRRERLRITWPDDLPIVDKRGAIAAAIAANQVVIVCGETGSGKSTQLPKICLDLGRGSHGLIGHTQPRRIAARSIADRLAEELGGRIGDLVGYTVRFSDHTPADALVKVMTDGILLAETQRDRQLTRYDTIIIDEAHERSLNIDFLLGYLKNLLPKRRDLKVIVTSATIDPDRLSAHFDAAPIVEVSGRTYPVETRYRPPTRTDPDERDRDMIESILEAVDEVAAIGPGDVLVFLSGEREIREVAEALRKHHPANTEILPLYARLSAADQHRVFEPSAGRRIVLATNVAETSLTVPGIRYVVDPGFARISRYSARTKVQRLPVEAVSQASARQRAGRCGRLGPGVCVRLYDESDFERREPFTPPEILRTNLASVILRMTALGLGNVAAFPFVEPPRRAMIRDGYETLRELGAIDAREKLTDIGRRLAKLPIDPRLGRMILAAGDEDCLNEVLVIASALAVQDPRDRPMERADDADAAHRRFADQDSDFLSYLAIWRFYHEQKRHLSWNKLRHCCRENFLSFVRMREWVDVHKQLLKLVTEGGAHPNREPAASDAIHIALLAGLLGNVGRREDNREYAGPRGAHFHVFPGSGLFAKPPKWVMAAEVVETTRRYARCVARIQPAWIERAGAHVVTRRYSDPRWAEEAQDVLATERVSLFGLEVAVRHRVPYGRVDPVAARELFIHHALVEGELRSDAPFCLHNRALIEELRALESKRRRRDVLVDVSEQYAFYDRRLPARLWSRRMLDAWRRKAERAEPRLLFMERADLARPDAADADVVAFPATLALDDAELPLSYEHVPGDDADGVTVTVPLPMLGRLSAERLEWLVPALLEEKVTALLRSLPKDVRRNFVPAPDFARACAARLEFGAGALVDAIAAVLHTMTGVEIPAEAWRPDGIPAHLRMRIRVTGDDGAEVAVDRDLESLRRRLGGAVRESFAKLAAVAPEHAGLVDWSFGDLPEQVELAGAAVVACPALIDEGETVAVRYLDTREAAAAETRNGLRRLILLRCRDQLESQIAYLPQLPAIEIAYAPFGTAAALRADLSLLAIERAFDLDGAQVRTEAAFAQYLEEGRSRVGESVYEAADLVEAILTAWRAAEAALAGADRPVWADIVAEAREHLGRLIGPSFLGRTPYARLAHFPRYLRAIVRRMEKLPGGGDTRDRAHGAALVERHRLYELRRADHAARGVRDPALEAYRWMLEEFRVSRFAQELGTPVKVSEKRVDEQWGLVIA